MDYKYIEQLLDKFWDCETSLEENKSCVASSVRKKCLPTCLAISPYLLIRTPRRCPGWEKISMSVCLPR